MTPENFCYWLQGYFEIGLADKNKGADSLSPQQVEEVRKHLALVMNRVTVKIDLPKNESIQEPSNQDKLFGPIIGKIYTQTTPPPQAPEVYCQANTPECSLDKP